METKHTPGPWECVPFGTNETHVVKMVSENTEESIAFVESVNAAADAKLIAAAPLMLEALQMAFDCDLTYLSDHAEIPRQDVVRARLAIRAALGYDG